MRKLMAALLAAFMMFGIVAQPAFAAPPSQASYGFSCFDEVCRLQLDLSMDVDEAVADDAWIEFMRSSIRTAPGAVGFAIGDAITISIPSGKLDLNDAELYVITDAEGQVTHLYGSAVLPAPRTGTFGDAVVMAPIRIQLGYDLGTHLVDLGAPVDPARRYWYFNLGSELRIQAADGSTVVVGAVPGRQMTVVTDPVQSATWFGGAFTVYPEELGDLGTKNPVADSKTEVLLEDLPMQGAVTFVVEGEFGAGTEPRLYVDASTRMEAQLTTERIALESVPLLLHGRAAVNPAGLMVGAAIATDPLLQQLLTAEALMQFFVPFSSAAELSAAVAAGVQIPLLGLNEAVARHAGTDPQQLIELTQGAWYSLAP